METFEGIEVNRINTLKKGDKFMVLGVWRVVTAVTKSEIKYRYLNANGGRGRDTLGAKSMQFVQIERYDDKIAKL